MLIQKLGNEINLINSNFSKTIQLAAIEYIHNIYIDIVMNHCSPETHTSQKKRTRGLTTLFRYLIYMAT